MTFVRGMVGNSRNYNGKDRSGKEFRRFSAADASKTPDGNIARSRWSDPADNSAGIVRISKPRRPKRLFPNARGSGGIAMDKFRRAPCSIRLSFAAVRRVCHAFRIVGRLAAFTVA